MNLLASYIKIIRPLNLLITFITVVVAGLICGESNISNNLLLGSLALSLSFAAGYIINDIIDYDIDKINRPERPLVSGNINKSSALYYFYLVALSSLFVSFLINYIVLIFISIIVFLVIIYSYNFKSTVLWGNILVAVLTSSAFLLGGIITKNFEASIIPAGFAFQVNFIREIIKDIEDIEGDKANNTITYPGKYGIAKSVNLINWLITILIISTVIPFILKLYSIEYLIIVMFSANIIFVYILFLLKNSNANGQIKKVSGLLKLSMIFGLIAIYFGV